MAVVAEHVPVLFEGALTTTPCSAGGRVAGKLQGRTGSGAAGLGGAEPVCAQVAKKESWLVSEPV